MIKTETIKIEHDMDLTDVTEALAKQLPNIGLSLEIEAPEGETFVLVNVKYNDRLLSDIEKMVDGEFILIGNTTLKKVNI